MTTIQFLLIGIGIGAVYVALGSGILVTYQATGVLNLGLGAIATYGAYTYAGLVGPGRLILPVGHVDTGVLPESAALVVAVALSSLVGLVAHLLVFRWLTRSSGLSRLVASVGLLLVLEELETLRFTSVNSAPSILPSRPVHVGAATVPSDRFVLAAVVIVVSALLALATRRTTVGLATRAVAEDESAASLLGWHPLRLGALAWVVSSSVAGLLGVLAVGITGVNAVSGSLLVVPALAVALLGRLRSYAVVVVGGLAIGALQSLLLNLQVEHTWLPQTGLREALPFVVIIVAVSLLGGRIPTRGTLEDPRLPAVPRGGPHLVGVAVGALLVAGIAATADPAYRGAITVSVISAVVALSIVLLTGMVGQVSLAQMTFAGTGGFTLSLLATRAHVPSLLAALCAVLVAMAVGVISGLPSLRVRGVTLGVITLGFGVAMSALVFENPSWTGGLSGSQVPALALFGAHLGGGSDLSFALTCVVVASALFLAVGTVRGNSVGAQMLLVRSNERAAAATGISTARVKLLAFAASAGIAGVAGVLFGYQQGGVSYQDYDVTISLVFLAVAYMSGITSLLGAALAGALAPNGIVVTLLQNELSIGKYMSLISAVGLLIAVTAVPSGIVGSLSAWLGRHARTPGRSMIARGNGAVARRS